MRFIKIAATLLVLMFWIVLVHKEWGGVKLKMLNHFMPGSYEELLRANTVGVPAGPRALEKYTRYFETLTWVMPKSSQGYELLGVCYFYSGKEERALKALQKAVFLNPRFFWSHYNLGILWLKKKDYPAAARSFEAATKLPPTETLTQIFNSRIYQDVLRSGGLGPQELIKDLQTGYQQAAILFKITSQIGGEAGRFDFQSFGGMKIF